MHRRKERTNEFFAGHRKRLKERFDRAGLEGFLDHEILEMLLFYAIPRKDVKPVAKSLLREFGTVRDVLAAPRNKLETCPGVGPETARFLNFIGELFLSFKSVELTSTGDSTNEHSPLNWVFEYLREWFRSRSPNLESIVVVPLTNGGGPVRQRGSSCAIKMWSQEGGFDRVPVVKEAIFRYLLNDVEKKFFVIAHNHPSGNPEPSSKDLLLTQELSRGAELLGLKLLDHVIVAGERHFSFREAGLL